MWQTLETKAKFIAQVRTGRTTARRIEDLDTPALTYAEVKAIASGNPLVIEKAKVDAEVMRLSRLRSEHSESQYGTRARLRMAAGDVARLERQVAAMEKDLATRQDTQGDKFRVKLDGKTYTDRAEAGNALVYLVNDHKDDHLRGRPGKVVLGEMAGFKLEYRSTLPDKITLCGQAEYTANASASPSGSISSLEQAARCIKEHGMRCREELARCQRNARELAALNGGVFEHEERYRELLQRQGELVDLLDIAKNQAAANQATEAKEGVDSVPAETAASEIGEAVKPAAAPRYFEDLSPGEQASQRARRKAEIEAIGRMKFPVSGDFNGQSVTILGPVARFSPYKEQSEGREDPFQLMVRSAEGDEFITFASGLKVDGKPMVSPVLSLRERRNPFTSAGGEEKQPPGLSRAKLPRTATVRVDKDARMKIAV